MHANYVWIVDYDNTLTLLEYKLDARTRTSQRLPIESGEGGGHRAGRFRAAARLERPFAETGSEASPVRWRPAVRGTRISCDPASAGVRVPGHDRQRVEHVLDVRVPRDGDRRADAGFPGGRARLGIGGDDPADRARSARGGVRNDRGVEWGFRPASEQADCQYGSQHYRYIVLVHGSPLYAEISAAL